MDAQEQKYSEEIRTKFGEQAKNLNDLKTKIMSAATLPPTKISQKEALTTISPVIAEVQDVLAMHADGSLRVSDEALKAAAKALGAAHTALDALVAHAFAEGLATDR